MTAALFCPVWACGAGIFSPDPVTMETGYIGHFILKMVNWFWTGHLLFFDYVRHSVYVLGCDDCYSVGLSEMMKMCSVEPLLYLTVIMCCQLKRY